MIALPMAVPFIVLVLAALVAMVGFRKTAVWVWFVALAVISARREPGTMPITGGASGNRGVSRCSRTAVSGSSSNNGWPTNVASMS